ncbi:MAG: metallopeptidase TldD-related protein [Bacillota bacterium]|nr:metallopeptidase TldD-related protein [Bacillota bacterium]
MMKIDVFYKQLEEKAFESGFENIELFYQEGKEFNAKIFREQLDNYQISEESGVSIRGEYKGKMGYYYSELIDESIIDEALLAIISNSQLMDVDDEKIIGEESIIDDSEDFDKSLIKSDYSMVIETMIENEKKLKGKDNLISEVPYNMYVEIENYTVIRNSKGVQLSQKMNLFYYVLSALAKNDSKGKTAMKILADKNPEKFNADELIDNVYKESTGLLEAESVPSGVYDVILRKDVSAEFLNAFSGIFSAEMVDKGISVLKEKVNRRVGNDLLTIIDSPFEKSAYIHRKFDDEGMLTKEKNLIKSGVLKGYLHNSKTAKKMNSENTGNAIRSGVKSSLGISHTNLFIKPSQGTLEEMIKEMGNGILIIELQALHSGLNAISGDFSLPAQGYLIESGEIVGTVDNITIAGNIMDVFNNVEKIGEDLEFYLPNNMGSVGSPSVMVKDIDITGK